MSGIYGFWNSADKMNQYKQDITGLALWNKAYGNAEEETFVGENFALGCSYEKLSDTAAKSAPVLKQNGKYAVIDALIYNREELMEKGRFTGNLSDEELIFAYMEKYGPDSLKDVNGDFCGAIYDVQEEKWILFRDHMGVRPLFYYISDDGVVFSTDIRGILSMQHVNAEIDEKWLWRTVVGDATMGTENTEFAHIFCVKPATYMVFSCGNKQLQVNKKSYWQLGSQKIRLSSESAYIERMRELITDAVKRRMDAISGQLGAELSGGLDSGVIDILINRMGRQCTYFSWSASPEEVPLAEDDERIIIADICKQENITCNYGKTFLPLDEQSIIAEKMGQIGVNTDKKEGIAMKYVLPPYVNTLQIAEAGQFVNRSGAKVVFTGHGGDEGVSHRCSAYEMFYHGEYYHYLRYMWSTTHGEKGRAFKTLKRCYTNITQTGKELKKTYIAPFSVKELLKADFYDRFQGQKSPALTFAYDAAAYIERGGSRNRLDVTALLGAYSGVRYLVPYLDYRVVDYAVSIPRYMYLKHRKNRYIFRETFKEMMPKSLYTLTTKQSNSWNNVAKAPKEQQDYLQEKKALVDILDRTYWEKYLDFDRIEQWMKEENQSDQEYDRGMFRHISNCIKVQSVVERSKLVGKATGADE